MAQKVGGPIENFNLGSRRHKTQSEHEEPRVSPAHRANHHALGRAERRAVVRSTNGSILRIPSAPSRPFRRCCLAAHAQARDVALTGEGPTSFSRATDYPSAFARIGSPLARCALFAPPRWCGTCPGHARDRIGETIGLPRAQRYHHSKRFDHAPIAPLPDAFPALATRGSRNRGVALRRCNERLLREDSASTCACAFPTTCC